MSLRSTLSRLARWVVAWDQYSGVGMSQSYRPVLNPPPCEGSQPDEPRKREEHTMANANPKPAPKLHSTRTPPPKLAESKEEEHEEGLIDEAVDESFPASDPPAISHPGGTLAVKKVAKTG